MRDRSLDPLPIDAVLPQLRDALRHRSSAVLVAPPGAGKTTRVPLALVDQEWLRDSRTVMLEPRRLAARAAARHMAQQLGEEVGETIGFRVRGESRVSSRTRVEVVTEGVLTRMLADDPTLEGIGLVIFDEFHERSLNADVGLALSLQSQRLVRDDLRLLVMSATLEGRAVAQLLGDAPVIESEGKMFPVTTHFVPPRGASAREAALLATIERALRDESGDVLAFLPGAGEIRHAAEALNSRVLPPGTYVVPLYGAMPLAEQDRAIRPSQPGTRKVVLATTIAQTSLTIEGVRIVIDSGLTRIPRYSPRSGMTRLETVRVSRSAADQRRGRAGRLAPGICYRLWDAGEDAMLRQHDIPEILEADLAPLALDLAAAGVNDPADLRWLDPPSAGAFAQGRELLRELGALDANGRVTAHGRELAALGTHPRLAHMLVRSRADDLSALAADLAALLEERDILGGPLAERDPDVRTRIELLHGGRASAGADRAAIERVRAAASRWRRKSAPPGAPQNAAAAGLLLALAYPDRIAQRRVGPQPRYVLRNGAGAKLPPGTALHNEPYLVAAELDGRLPESLILLAAPISLSEIEQHFGDQVVREDVITWDNAAGSVKAQRRRMLGALVLSDDPLATPDVDQVQKVVLDAIIASDFALLSWSKETTALRERMAFVHAHDASWPDVSLAALRQTAGEWLGQRLDGVRRREDIARIPLAEALAQLLTWQQRTRLDELAPTHFNTPAGFRARIDYSDPQTPMLAARMQDLFGLTKTPRVLGGRVPLTLHLLAPNQRPVQVTQDLESFWKGAYREVRTQLRARYPKHKWPEDPSRT
ncbi:MAG TPA: ATP-dependent helicase HrpB [Gemmatimonadaceae bacterium]